MGVVGVEIQWLTVGVQQCLDETQSTACCMESKLAGEV